MMPREFHSISSSMMTGAAYDESSEQLYIEFSNGTVHEYDNVPQDIYEGLVGGGSAGSFFHNNIKGRFSTRQV